MFVPTPPMGYNTWNTFGEEICDSLIRETADAMVESGLLDAGYKYLVIDDCWSERSRDPLTDRLVPDHVKFPYGMKSVADYVHSKGLKFGMYSCDGVRTCADYPGSFGHEFLDARTFAEFGVDFLKYDNCYKPESVPGYMLYRKMGIALENCGREILFSACNWGCDDVHRWIRSTGASMYRSTGDICDSFKSMTDIALSQLDNYCYSAPGCFNDIDMLVAGMFGSGNVARGDVCTLTDYETHFALWCLLGAPLMIGCDVRSMTPEIRALLTNRELIAINQDIEVRPAYRIDNVWSDKSLVLFRHLSGGEYALGMFNLTDGPHGMYVTTNDVGLDSHSGLALQCRDVISGEEFRPEKDYFRVNDVPAHGCRIFRCRFVKA
ncbi:MAG: glycoside hydrolase family 27 protein [Clostridia bacterium]|nr:glycoside hydrolase family 27 protein [Clostridia bacterium]